jgi:SAM-dependent methyltransferase
VLKTTSNAEVMNMNNTPVQKIELLRKYFERHPESIREGNKIIDIGGITPYYNLLASAVSPAELYLLNMNPRVVNGAPAIIANAMRLPFTDQAWNIIISFNVLEHLQHPESFISEVYRILRDDGLFILSTPNLADLYSRVTFLFGYTPFNYDPSSCKSVALSKLGTTTREHKSVFTYKGLLKFLTYNGFQIVESKGYPATDSLYHRLDSTLKERQVGAYRMRRSLGSILPPSLSEQMFFVCEKSESFNERARCAL